MLPGAGGGQKSSEGQSQKGGTKPSMSPADVAIAMSKAKSAAEHWDLHCEHVARSSHVAGLFTSATITTRTCAECQFVKTSFDTQASTFCGSFRLLQVASAVRHWCAFVCVMDLMLLLFAVYYSGEPPARPNAHFRIGASAMRRCGTRGGQHSGAAQAGPTSSFRLPT